MIQKYAVQPSDITFTLLFWNPVKKSKIQLPKEDEIAQEYYFSLPAIQPKAITADRNNQIYWENRMA